MKAAIFDFNGTLFYDTDKHKEAWKRYGEELMGRPVTENEFQTSMLGRSNKLILSFLLGREPSDNEIKTMGGEKEAVYRRLCLADPSSMHLAPGAEKFLNHLKKCGIPCTIATSSDLENLNFYFEHFRLEQWFKKELCVYENGSFNGKPAPDIYLLAAERLGIAPCDCTVFEDALSGIAAAHSAGAGEIIAVASSASADILGKTDGVSRVIDDYSILL